MTPDDAKLLPRSSYSGSYRVQVGNGTLLPFVHYIAVSTPQKHLHLNHVLHVPQLSSNALSTW